MYRIFTAVTFLVMCFSAIAAASDGLLPKRCESDAYIYQWRDADGQLQLSDCAPDAVEGVRRIQRSSLQPTLIQPPSRPARSKKSSRTKRKKKRSSTRSDRLNAQQLRDLSVKCRWLVGRVEHLRGLVEQHRQQGQGRSIWQSELSRRRAELRKQRCGVRL